MSSDRRTRPTGKIGLSGADEGNVVVAAPLPAVGWVAIGYFDNVEGEVLLRRLEIMTEHEGHDREPALSRVMQPPELPTSRELGAAQLRSVPLAKMHETAYGLSEQFRSHVTVQKDRSRPGRRGRDDSYYARWAAAYVEALRASADPDTLTGRNRPRPVEALAKRENLSPSQIRNILHQARRRKLLTDAPPGRAGGTLTTKCRVLLETEYRQETDHGPHPEA